MTKTQDAVIRVSKGTEDFVEVPASIVLEEGALYIHIEREDMDIALSLSSILPHLAEQLLEGS